MAIPSGSGTEVLKRAFKHNNSATQESLITGVANHIYTILTIVASEASGADETIGIRVDTNASGSDQINLLDNAWPLPAGHTFTWNDKFVITGTDKLEVYNSSGNVDWYVSYIDQDWT